MIKKIKNPRKTPVKSDDVPVTKRMLFEVRDELSSKFAALEHRIDRRFKNVDHQFKTIDAQFKTIDDRFDQVDARFDRLEDQFKELKLDLRTHLHKTSLLIEEQNARNKFVLDGYQNLFERQDRTEDILKTLVEKLARL